MQYVLSIGPQQLMASEAKSCISSQGPWRISKRVSSLYICTRTQPGSPQTFECKVCAHTQADASLTPKV